MNFLTHCFGLPKNTKMIGVLLATAFFNLHVYAQNHPPGFYKVFDNSAGLVMEIPLAVKGDLGEMFISDMWRQGTIELFNELKIDEYYFKYEIARNHIELQTNEGIKILPGKWIKKFDWKEPELNKERRFVTGSAFFQDKMPLNGFFEVLFGGEVGLLLRFEVEAVKSDYVPQFNIGTPGQQYQKKEAYYMVESGNTFLLRKKTKQNLPYFGENAANVESYMKAKRLKFSRPDDLIQIIKYYSSLRPTSN